MPRVKQQLGCLILLGFLIRVWFMFYSDHQLHPDEIFQMLEPAHRLAFGYGIIPWDFQYGLRSYIYPFLLSLPLLLTKLVHLDTPAIYIPFIKLILISCSLVTIPAGFMLVLELTKSPRISLFTAYVLAIWYELVYFAPRALTEIFATYWLALCLILFFKYPKRLFLSGFLLMMACLTRIQYGLVAVPLGVAIWHRVGRRKLLPYIGGAVLAILIFGVTDVFAYGQFLVHLSNNLRISYLSGLSVAFGTKPWWYYSLSLLRSSAGLCLLSGLTLRLPRARPYLMTLVVILLIHSLIPHKEYRFLFLLVPLYLCLTITSVAHFITRHFQVSLIVVTLISFLGFADRLPQENLVYAEPPLLQDPLLNQETKVLRPTNCPVSIPDRGWVYTGGYYYLHQPIPFYTLDYPPPASTAAFIILPNYQKPPPTVQLVARSKPYTLFISGAPLTHPGYSLYSPTGGCPAPITPSFTRQPPAYLVGYLASFKPL